MSLSDDFYKLAASHQGGHSDEGRRIAEALEVPFPITMGGLIAGAVRDGLNPAELWPWCDEATKRPANLIAAVDALKAPTMRRHKARQGECAYCDSEREANVSFHPPHDASPRCESGKHNHCSCDTCF